MNFFITGLPRSRTAWLANLFTTGPIFCWHDALKDSLGVRGLVEKDREARRTFGGVTLTGDADTGAVFFTSQLITAFTAAKWVFIHRAFEDCFRSFQKEFAGKLSYDVGQRSFAVAEDKLHEAIEIVPEKNQILVDFDDLSNLETLRAVWNFCAPSQPFSLPRVDLLNTLRVNVIAEKAYRGLI
jgi:hypothetical protein